MLYKALAGSVGMRLFNVGESDDRGQELTCHELLGELRLYRETKVFTNRRNGWTRLDMAG